MSRDRKLSADERILWSKVAHTTRPMPGRKKDLQALEAFVAETQAMEEKKEAGENTGSTVPAATPNAGVRRPSGIHQPLERPVKRKLAKGQLTLEARIDLHGLFQDEAHAMLLDFLLRAHGRGLRHVLVITGKGSSMGSDGALKRAVPLWFGKPEFRYLISSYESAAQTHGGDGALYVRLSRMRGDRS